MDELQIQTIVHTVNDGVQLMEYLLKQDAPLPHLLFVDLNMPRKNGLECLKEIRSDERLSAMAIAIYSTSASEKELEATFLHGANVYIKKPNDFNLLKKILDKAIMDAAEYQTLPVNRSHFLLQIS